MDQALVEEIVDEAAAEIRGDPDRLSEVLTGVLSRGWHHGLVQGRADWEHS